MEHLLEAMEAIQKLSSAFIFLAAFAAVALASLLALIRWRPWCACSVCRAYVTSSWSADFTNLGDWYAHLLRSSPTRTIHVHVLDSTITANPANVEHILRSRFDIYPKGPAFSSILGDLLGRGIFNADGKAWSFQRRLASLELSSPSLRSFSYSAFASLLRLSLLPYLRRHADEHSVLDFQSTFRRFAFNAICAVSFGLDPGDSAALPLSAFAAAFDTATSLSAARAASVTPALWRAKRLLNLGSEHRLRRALSLVDLLASRIICHRRRCGLNSSPDLLSCFMASVNDERYLRDIVISFLLAGRDTIAAALTGLFLLLPRHPSVVAMMRCEIDSAVTPDADGGVVASCEVLRGMPYVHAVLHEGMRLFPPVQFDSKFCAEDDVLPDGTFVRKGTRVTYHTYAMGRMEAEWGSDCEKFRPERWLRNGVFSPESPFKYPVFQGGQRMCVGKELALLEMKAVVVAVVGEFDVDLVDSEKPVRFVPGLTATLQGWLPVSLRRRQHHGIC